MLPLCVGRPMPARHRHARTHSVTHVRPDLTGRRRTYVAYPSLLLCPAEPRRAAPRRACQLANRRGVGEARATRQPPPTPRVGIISVADQVSQEEHAMAVRLGTSLSGARPGV